MANQAIDSRMAAAPGSGMRLPGGHAERQLSELAAAIREHEAATRGRPLGIRSPDANLYRRLRQICGRA